MSVRWKPEGHSSVSPYIMVAGAQRLIDFHKRTFGATELRRYDMTDGSIMHAEVRIDDSVIMLADAGGKWAAFPIWCMCWWLTSMPFTGARWQPAA
jgi:PhnB protein